MNSEQKIDTTALIEKEINDNEVLLFMKGTPVFPMCGFSANVVEILTKIGSKFHSINVLDNPEIREDFRENLNKFILKRQEDNKFITTRTRIFDKDLQII